MLNKIQEMQVRLSHAIFKNLFPKITRLCLKNQQDKKEGWEEAVTKLFWPWTKRINFKTWKRTLPKGCGIALKIASHNGTFRTYLHALRYVLIAVSM